MTFENNKAIYEQMADRLCDEIIAETYKADDRIPSVREYAVTLQVNTNTAVKAFVSKPFRHCSVRCNSWVSRWKKWCRNINRRCSLKRSPSIPFIKIDNG